MRLALRNTLFVAFISLVASRPASSAVIEQSFSDVLVLDYGQSNPHDHTTFAVARFDPGLGTLTAVNFTLRSQFSGSVLFHGVHGEGYFHYTPRNFVESEIFGVSDPPSPIVDNEQPTLTCHAGYPGGPFDVSCTLATQGDLSDEATVSGANLESYEGSGSYEVLVTQEDRSLYFGNFPPDPGGPIYTGLTYAPFMTSTITFTVAYTYTPEASAVPPGPAHLSHRILVTPNPCASSTEITFELPEDAPLEITVHDAAGRAIRSLASGNFLRGRQSLDWDLRDADGRPVSPGIYLIRAAGAGTNRIGRAVVTR